MHDPTPKLFKQTQMIGAFIDARQQLHFFIRPIMKLVLIYDLIGNERLSCDDPLAA